MLSITVIFILLAISLFSYHITPILFSRITSTILIYSALLSINVIDISSLASGVGIYSGFFHVNITSLSIDAFIFICASIIILSFTVFNYTFHNNIITTSTVKYSSVQEYSLMVVFIVIGQSLLISSSDIVSIFLSIELQSFAIYVLCTLYKNSMSSTSAGLKYFLLGGLSSAVILLGTGVIYSYTGLTEFESIYLLCQVNDGNSMFNEVTLGLVLIGIGFLFKVASAPLHNWAPDVYDGTPTIVTIFISTIPKISLFVFILELQTGIEGSFGALSLIQNNIEDNYNNIFKNLLLIGSILSLIIGTVIGLSQHKIKRLIAYSTISHVGFILLALLINSKESIESFLFYIIQYSVTNICAFLCLLQIGYMRINTVQNNISEDTDTTSNDIEFINDIKGEFNRNPILTFAFSMCLFSIAGIPPLIGFFAKQIVLYSSLENEYYFISIICVVVSIISSAYYLKIIKVIYFSTPSETPITFTMNNVSTIKDYNYAYTDTVENNIRKNISISSQISLSISVLVIIITIFVLQPQILLNSSNLIALTLFNY